MSTYRRYSRGYEDDRRRPPGHDSNRFEPYKSPGDRNQPHGRNDPGRNQSRDMESGRRGPGDARDTRNPRAPRSPRRELIDVPNRLHIDTKVADRPRQSASSTQSPASALGAAQSARPTPTEPTPEKVVEVTGASNTTATTYIPKAKDAQLQAVLEDVDKCATLFRERMLLEFRKDKLTSEEPKRQSELGKIANKGGAYAPYSEFQRRFNERGNRERDSLSQKIADSDRQCAEAWEKTISSALLYRPSNPQTAAQGASISALKAQFADFQKHASEQQKENSEKLAELQKLASEQQAEQQRQLSEQQKQLAEAQSQIQTLLSDREKTTEALSNLDKDFKGLKSDFAALQSENLVLKKQIEEFNTAKRAPDTLPEEFQSVTSKVEDIEREVKNFMKKVENLDMETYEDILEAWTDHDFKNKVLSNEKLNAALQQDLEKHDVIIQNMRETLQAVESSRLASPKPSGHTSEEAQRTQQDFVEKKLNSFNEVLQKIIADSGDACADMVDEVRHRVKSLEDIVNKLGQSKPPSKDPDTVSRVGSLEGNLNKQGANIKSLRGLVESFEKQQFGLKIDTMGLHLADIEKRMQKIQGNIANEGPGGSNLLIQSIKPDIDDARKRIDALDHSMRTLDKQWANVNTKQMADMILLQLDPYAQRNEARVTVVEKDVLQLRDKLLNFEQSLLVLSKDSKRLADVTKASPFDKKRQASPGSPAEDPLKKRKLTSNGQHAPLFTLRSSSHNL